MKFTTGDRVALSATFLRSICPNAHRGWPTTQDLGKGTVIVSIDCAGTELVDVWFDRGMLRRFNAFNLIKADARTVYNDAMRAEHKSRNITQIGK